jgi:ribonucleoside-diphosphate reductase alpha chain
LRDGTLETRSIDHIDKPLETRPEQMFERIARHIASVEKTPELREEWQGNLLTSWMIGNMFPAGRIFTGAGTGQNLTYYNCYVIPSPKDSRGKEFLKHWGKWLRSCLAAAESASTFPLFVRDTLMSKA